MRAGRWLVAVFLAADVIDTAAWLGSVMPDAGGLGTLALGLVLLRGLVGSIEGVSVWLLLRRERPARLPAVAGLVGAAALTTLIVGLGLAPSDVAPGWREIVVAVYWIAAAAGAFVLGRATAL